MFVSFASCCDGGVDLSDEASREPCQLKGWWGERARKLHGNANARVISAYQLLNVLMVAQVVVIGSSFTGNEGGPSGQGGAIGISDEASLSLDTTELL